MVKYDTSNEMTVGFDLLERCHYITGYTVLSFVFVPGIFYRLKRSQKRINGHLSSMERKNL